MADIPPNFSNPGAHLDGFQLPSDFKLPLIKLVREDAARLPSLKRGGPGRFRMMNNGKVPGKKFTDELPEPLAYNCALPHLFKWSYFVRTQDVANDLLEDCIWALKMVVRVWEEGSEDELRIIGHVLPGNKYEVAKYLALSNARWKVSYHLMKPEINCPAEAIPYMQLMVEEEHRRMNQPWITNPELFASYGEALVRACSDDEGAKRILERILPSTGSSLPTGRIVSSKVFLACVLRRLGNEEKAIEHEAWAIKWFRKNPHVMYDSDIRHLLVPDGETTSPILDGLGGPSWLDERKHSFRTDHNITKQCRQCLARPPQTKLFQCSKCKHTYYCSSECQTKDWKHHKAGCKEIAETLKRISQLALTNPEGAQKAADWKVWRGESFNDLALIHALGLHRDPKRGKSHIVIKQVQYTPKASKQFRYKFRVLSCGVFRISDILPEIEYMLRINRGEGTEYIQGLMEGMKRQEYDGTWRIPMIDLSFGEGVETWLGATSTTQQTLTKLPYDPQWRGTFNLGESPRKLLRLKGRAVEDQEQVF